MLRFGPRALPGLSRNVRIVPFWTDLRLLPEMRLLGTGQNFLTGLTNPRLRDSLTNQSAVTP